MKKEKNIFKLYAVLGKAFCACAGGAIGFVLGGPLIALPGIFLGSISGYFLEKAVNNT